MSPKKNSSNSTGMEKDKSLLNNNRIEEGNKREVRVSDLAAQHSMAKSTIYTFLKNKEAIKADDAAK